MSGYIDHYQYTKEKSVETKLHVSLDVVNLDKSVQFYTTLFGAQPTKLKPGYAKFDLASPAVNLTMQEKEHCCLQGLSHLGIRVDSTEEVLEYKRRLSEAGIKTEEEMNTTCCYAVQDKIWATDPSGYRWEVYVFKGDAQEAREPKDVQKEFQKACCV